jgi:hypothetical protein
MTQTRLFAASVTALLIACAAGWVFSETHARVAAGAPMDPFTIMTSATQMPSTIVADYSFVF